MYSEKASLLAAWPVGSIYIAYNSTSPASLFSGTWLQIKDRFLLGIGSTYTTVTTGGAANHGHNGGGNAYIGIQGDYIYQTTVSCGAYGANLLAKLGNTTTSTYNSTLDYATKVDIYASSTSNMPPYQTVYMWRRTA